jgi:hypothetical protein
LKFIELGFNLSERIHARFAVASFATQVFRFAVHQFHVGISDCCCLFNGWWRRCLWHGINFNFQPGVAIFVVHGLVSEPTALHPQPGIGVTAAARLVNCPPLEGIVIWRRIPQTALSRGFLITWLAIAPANL